MLFKFKKDKKKLENIKYMMEFYNISLDDITKELRKNGHSNINENKIDNIIKGRKRDNILLEEIDLFLVSLIAKRRDEAQKELAIKYSLPELYDLLDSNKSLQYTDEDIRYVINNYYKMEYLALRNNLKD